MKAFQMDLMPVQQVADAFSLLVRGTILENKYYIIMISRIFF